MRSRRLPAAAGFVIAACLAASGAGAADRVFVVTSQSAAGGGNSTAFDLEAPWAASVDVEPTGFRTTVRHFGGRLYVVHPQTDEIQVIDAQSLDTVATFSAGAGSEPHDILVAHSGSAWVSRHASNLLHEVDPATGALLDTVDLGPLADADGIPEMSMLARDDSHLFVQVQRLDAGGVAVPPSYLAVVDLSTNELAIDVNPDRAGVQGIELTGPIPRYKMQIEGRRLYVSEPGTFHDGAGGIDEIDLDTLTALGYITSEAQVPLDISGFVLTSPTKGYVLTHTDFALSSHLQPFSRVDGSGLGPELVVTFDQVDVVAHDPRTDQLFFPYPDGGGVLVFDATTHEQLTTEPIATGFDPFDLVILYADGPGEATDLRVESIHPVTERMSLSYTPACSAPQHTVVFGPLDDVASHGYAGQLCEVGNDGTISGFDPGAGSFFFLVVGNDGAGIEGSYGTDSTSAERPEDLADPACVLVRELALRCD